MHSESGYWMATSWPKIRKETRTWPFINIDVIVNFFWRCRVFLVKFSYWPKFHINMMTSPWVMTIFVYKGLARNPEIENTSSELCSISRDWGELGIPDLARKSLIKSYWMHSHKKRKIVETRAVLLIYSLELEISGVAIQRIHQNSK